MKFQQPKDQDLLKFQQPIGPRLIEISTNSLFSLFVDEITRTILKTKRNTVAEVALSLDLELKIASCSLESDLEEGEDSVEY